MDIRPVHLPSSSFHAVSGMLNRRFYGPSRPLSFRKYSYVRKWCEVSVTRRKRRNFPFVFSRINSDNHESMFTIKENKIACVKSSGPFTRWQKDETAWICGLGLFDKGIKNTIHLIGIWRKSELWPQALKTHINCRIYFYIRTIVRLNLSLEAPPPPEKRKRETNFKMIFPSNFWLSSNPKRKFLLKCCWWWKIYEFMLCGVNNG